MSTTRTYDLQIRKGKHTDTKSFLLQTTLAHFDRIILSAPIRMLMAKRLSPPKLSCVFTRHEVEGICFIGLYTISAYEYIRYDRP
jgi:hypothetical protein